MCNLSFLNQVIKHLYFIYKDKKSLILDLDETLIHCIK